MWEPILNETWYPEDFACNVVNILKEEYPYPYCYAGCDVTARGHEYFPIFQGTLNANPNLTGNSANKSEDNGPAFLAKWAVHPVVK